MAGSSLQLKRSKKGVPKAVEGKVGAEDACVELKFPLLDSKAFYPFCCRRSWTEDMAVSLSPDLLFWMLFKEPNVTEFLFKRKKVLKNPSWILRF